MKYFKILITTICFVFIGSISIYSSDVNEWSWDIDDYHYELIKKVQYNEWNRTDVSVHYDENINYVTFSAGTIEGELAEFEVYIADLDGNPQYVYKSKSALSYTMSFSEIGDINLIPGEYRLSIVAKGFQDQSLDDYTLYVSYVEPDNSTDSGIEETEEINPTEEIKPTEAIKQTETTEQNKGTLNNKPNTSVEKITTTTKVAPPKRVTLQSAKRQKNNKKKAKLTWKKLKGNNIRYEIKCSTNKKFTKKNTKTYVTKKYTYTVSKLNKNKKYFVKVRAFRTINGKKIYGSYSKIKTINKTK